jgi:hypothetical protein
MRSYFRGWKRKFGVLALGMALVFMGLWIRGLAVTDLYKFGSGPGTTCHNLVLSQHGIMWMRLEVFGDSIMSWTSGWKNIDPSTILYDDPKMKRSPADIKWQWSWCGFDLCQMSHDSDERCCHQNNPYWSIVIPLTLLSAWCLLSKPRSKTQSAHPIARLPPDSVA